MLLKSLKVKTNFLSTKSIRVRVILALGFILLALSVLTNLVFYLVYSSSAASVKISDENDKLFQTMSYTDSILKNVEQNSDMVWAQQGIQNSIDSIIMNKQNPFVYSDILNYLQQYAATMREITSIDLYISSRQAFITSDSGMYMPRGKNLEKLYDYYQNVNSVTWINDYFTGIDIAIDRPRELITLIRPVFSIVTGDKIGFLAISIETESFKNSIGINNNNSDYNIFVLSENKTIIKSLNKEFINEQNTKKISELKNSYFKDKKSITYDYLVFITSKYNGWTYVSKFPESSIVRSIGQVRNYILLILIAFAATFLLVAYFTSTKMLEPVNSLVSVMKLVEQGNFQARITQKRKDEFGYIFDNFNKMTEKIQFLFTKLFEEEVLKKDAELKLLQSKINPHFIYNIFNDMSWLLELQRYDDLGEMIYAVSNFYKKSLNSGDDFIFIFDNVQLLRYYCNIQKIRFTNNFECNIDIAGELMDKKIPNFMLQPLLENSIAHGIEPKKEGGVIKIYGYLEDDDMLFVVEDNGVGIEEKKLEQICLSLNDESSKTSDNFALININRRIKLYYGDKYSLNISSIYGKGTRVEFKIPISNDKISKFEN